MHWKILSLLFILLCSQALADTIPLEPEPTDFEETAIATDSNAAIQEEPAPERKPFPFELILVVLGLTIVLALLTYHFYKPEKPAAKAIAQKPKPQKKPAPAKKAKPARKKKKKPAKKKKAGK